jgi:hypothetical protein
MSAVVDRLQSGIAALLHAGGPTLVFGLAGALVGVLVALAGFRGAARLLEWRGKRSARVALLAARGVSRAEIARRTGLSQDAIGMLLRVRPGRSSRRNLPAPARIAAPGGGRAHRRNRDWNPQVVARARDTALVAERPMSARPLPFRIPRNSRFTRSGQAA